MIVQLKDRCSGYSEFFREHFNNKYRYTIDTEKVVYISENSYSDHIVIAEKAVLFILLMGKH